MSDYYSHFLASMSGASGTPTPTLQDSQSTSSQAATHMDPSLLGETRQMPTPSAGAHNQAASSSPLAQPKSRKKSAAGLGGELAVKHRRTRSGCFMCRTRRVKCDEARPVCERCKKGNRDCVYPNPPETTATQGSKLRGSRGTTQQPSPLSSVEESDDVDQASSFPTTGGPGSLESTAAARVRFLAGREGVASSADSNSGSSPSASTETSPAASHPDIPTTGGATPDWSGLPTEMQNHLKWFGDNMTHYHYCLPSDFDDFFKVILPSIASVSEPLLNALVGFSAYHATLRNPEGKLEDFLRYYNKSVILLLESLKKKEKHDIGTLLTILQLATIEEYLGDWVNLMGHQKAAFEIITKLFTPQTVMETPLGRMCHLWYTRFDNFCALMGGFPTDLSRDWFTAAVTYRQHRADTASDRQQALRWKIEARAWRLRVITYDMSILFSRGSRGQITPENFNTGHSALTRRLEEWRDTWDPDLCDPQYLVSEFPHKRSAQEEDIVDPYAPDILYDFPLFSSTVIMAEWHSIMIMHHCQSSNTPPEELFMALRKHAYATCQYFEALQLWPSTPKGTTILAQSCVAIAALWLPQNEKHQMWCRRKFAYLETLGYIQPLSLRAKMAQMFREPSCVRWWLSDDEGYSPVLQSIRQFADERNAAAVNAQHESLREVQHIFSKMSLHEQEDPRVKQGLAKGAENG